MPTSILRTAFGGIVLAAVLILSCTGDLAQKGKLADHSSSYRTIDLSHLDIVLESPESFVVDPASGCYFISNVNGASDARDDNGFIIKLDSNFNLIDNFFIDGRAGAVDLHAPRGLHVRNGVLYVCDLETVRAFSCETGAGVGGIDFAATGASFLNGITTDEDGIMYVSDTYQNKVYSVDPAGNIAVHADIKSPNGLCIGPEGALYVVTWEASRRLWLFPSARLFRIDGDGRIKALWFETEFENLDGVDVDNDGRLVFSDYGRGVVYTFDVATGLLATIATGLQTPADITCDRSRGLILIPDLQGALVVLKQNYPEAPTADSGLSF